jgi:hypothetical protein
MEPTRTRYPGAHPFADDALSRAVFFGREKEATALMDQIVANRLVVVYAKSGLGKTSLLHAGLCQPLRDDGFLPLVVRVNDIKQGPVRSLYDGVRTASEHQHIEYQAGSELSLWHFFKTVEFWRGDLLLTPVLILDQFEELFTLHSVEARAGFLAELGCLVRGVRPETDPATEAGLDDLTDSPPKLRIALSLREDYLALLEEAADNIPQILDHRFRLTPLGLDAAAAAMVGPSQVRDGRLATRPFAYDPETVQGILEYLSRRLKTGAVSSAKFVEPFHLQLICQRVEALVAERQLQTETIQLITLNDLGGEKGLRTTLLDFYNSVLGAIARKSTRKKVRRLCEQYLISPDGRRLSLEEEEIGRLLGIEPAGLKWLVKRRLLRCDQRADSWYYELSHDSLVEPILAARKTQRVFLEGPGLLGAMLWVLLGFGGALGGVLAAVIFILGNMALVDVIYGEILSGAFICASIIIIDMGIAALRRSADLLGRYMKRLD